MQTIKLPTNEKDLKNREFVDRFIKMDRAAVKMYEENMFSDIFTYFIQTLFILFSGYGAFWIYTHRLFIPIVPWFCVYIGCTYGFIKQIVDTINLIRNHIARYAYYKTAKKNIAYYDKHLKEERTKEKKKNKVFVEDKG